MICTDFVLLKFEGTLSPTEYGTDHTAVSTETEAVSTFLLRSAEPRRSILKQFGSDQTATNHTSERLFAQSLA